MVCVSRYGIYPDGPTGAKLDVYVAARCPLVAVPLSYRTLRARCPLVTVLLSYRTLRARCPLVTMPLSYRTLRARCPSTHPVFGE